MVLDITPNTKFVYSLKRPLQGAFLIQQKVKVLPTIYSNMLWFLRWHATISVSKEKSF